MVVVVIIILVVVVVVEVVVVVVVVVVIVVEVEVFNYLNGMILKSVKHIERWSIHDLKFYSFERLIQL